MILQSRKLYICLGTLAVLLAVYAVYNRIILTPEIKIERQSASEIPDANLIGFESQHGKIGNFEVGSVRKARYTQLDENRNLSREFGFDALLYESGNEWGIEKPYMCIYQPSFICRIESDSGKVQVETVGGKPSPKDARLKGNVVVHITPRNGGRLSEGFIYLDDISYVSDRSQFTTDGPVRFVSNDAEMVGRGLDIIYDGRTNQIEFFRLTNLEHLRIKRDYSGSSGGSVSPSDRPDVKEQTVAADSQPSVKEAGEKTYYRCVFKKNVVIEYGRQKIFSDELAINNILFSDNSKEKGVLSVKDTSGAKAAPQAEKQTSENPEILVTCDNGILFQPIQAMGGEDKSKDVVAEAAIESAGSSINAKQADGDNDRNKFFAEKIDYDVATGNAVAAGPVEFSFYPEEKDDSKSDTVKSPVTITAKNDARFDSKISQVVFNGDVVGSMIEENGDFTEQNRVYGDKLTVDLSDNSSGIRHINVSGPQVRMVTSRSRQSEKLGGTELKCAMLDYDAEKEIIKADGPGQIVVNNSDLADGKGKKRNVSLSGRCYSYIDGFDALQWFVKDKRLTADGASKGVHIGYLPILDDGKYGRKILIDAGRIEVLYATSAEGRDDVVQLVSSGGISYQEADRYQFVGEQLIYEADKSLISVNGAPGRPCLFNGALVDGIKYNPETGRLNASVAGPGTFQYK